MLKLKEISKLFKNFLVARQLENLNFRSDSDNLASNSP